MQFKRLISRVYKFFSTGNPNLWSILKPEVELMVFLRISRKNSRKTAENAIKIQFEGVILHRYMLCDTGNPNLRSILKPEVELMVLLRMRSNKITKNDEKCP